MSERDARESEGSADRKSRRELHEVTDTLAGLFSDVADAMGEGFRTLRDEIQGRPDADRGAETVAKGVRKGFFQALEDSARSAREAFEELADEKGSGQAPKATTEPALEGLDYERLAKLVARELRAQPGDAGASPPAGVEASSTSESPP
jgi:hypothetical protein